MLGRFWSGFWGQNICKLILASSTVGSRARLGRRHETDFSSTRGPALSLTPTQGSMIACEARGLRAASVKGQAAGDKTV